MQKFELGVGSRIKHTDYGEGIITANRFQAYNIYFPIKGKIEIPKDSEDLTIVDAVAPDEDHISLGVVEEVLIGILKRYSDQSQIVPLSDKYSGGSFILQPKDKSLKGTEVPIENFYHKLVMLRDRLRVLEQNINSHKVLTDVEKVNIQQYITRIYGTLTTFNVLFKNPDHKFVGEKTT